MARSFALIVAAALLAGAVLVATRPAAWSAVVLLAAVGAAWAWYRARVARSTASVEQFFGGIDEDTRLTSFQGAAPGEMPGTDQPSAPPAARRADAR